MVSAECCVFSDHYCPLWKKYVIYLPACSRDLFFSKGCIGCHHHTTSFSFPKSDFIKSSLHQILLINKDEGTHFVVTCGRVLYAWRCLLIHFFDSVTDGFPALHITLDGLDRTSSLTICSRMICSIESMFYIINYTNRVKWGKLRSVSCFIRAFIGISDLFESSWWPSIIKMWCTFLQQKLSFNPRRNTSQHS